MMEKRAEIQKYVSTIKTLQALVHLYRFFKKRDNLLSKLFEGVPHPNFEVMAENFITIADDRYPSSAKILQVIEKMKLPGLKEEIAVLSMMRDAVREVSPNRLYRSIQQRDDVFSAIIEALESLEDALEEKMAEEEEEERSENL